MKTIILILLYILTISTIKSQPKNLITSEVKSLLQEINKVRIDPKQYSIDNNLFNEKLDTLLSKKALKLDYKLCQKAYSYSDFLSKQIYNELYIICNHSQMGYHESIALNPNLKEVIYDLILDKDSAFKGHRFHLLGVNNNDTKIGIAVSYIKQLDWYVVVIITN